LDLAIALSIVMLGSGLLRSILIIHNFYSPISVLTEVSAMISAPNCCSIFRETGLDILE
jgi:hypothetical protein